MGDTLSAMHAFRFRPYGELDGEPNVVVDGSPAEGTVLTISHWPGTPAPPALHADLSAEMAFLALQHPELLAGADLVSNNHFDQDGLAGVFALVDPEEAVARQARLVDVAGAGDFAVYRDRDAARISMVVAAYADPARSPLELPGDYPSMCAALYEELLPRVPELCDHPERFRSLWEDEDAALAASEAAIESGAVRIEEVPALDLAVVTLPPGAPDGGGHRFGGEWASGLHPMAVHNATSRFAVPTSFGLAYRYETWVQYRSRRPRPRVDLAPLASELNAEESSGGTWVFDGAAALTPRLHLQPAIGSSLSPDDFRRRVERALRESPPAWDPYAT